MKEKRVSRRVRCSVAEYSIAGQDGGKEAAFIKDISLTGVCLVVIGKISIGTILSVKIYLPHIYMPLKISGDVIWAECSDYFKGGRRRHYDVGVEFRDISSHDKKLLQDYITYFKTSK